MAAIKDMLLDALHHLGIGEEMVHLVHPATLTLILVVLSVLIIIIAILMALLNNHTYTVIAVVMVHHHSGQQHTERRHPQTEHIQSSFAHSGCKVTPFKAILQRKRQKTALFFLKKLKASTHSLQTARIYLQKTVPLQQK